MAAVSVHFIKSVLLVVAFLLCMIIVPLAVPFLLCIFCCQVLKPSLSALVSEGQVLKFSASLQVDEVHPDTSPCYPQAVQQQKQTSWQHSSKDKG